MSASDLAADEQGDRPYVRFTGWTNRCCV